MNVIHYLYDHPNNSSLPAEPSRQFLVRVDADGTTEKWSLYGFRITLEPDFELGHMLRVRFDSQSRYDTGNRINRVNETTLRVGGRR